jgi:hypothetical protein
MKTLREKAVEILSRNNLPLGHNFTQDEHLPQSIAAGHIDALERAGIVLRNERHDEILWACIHRIQDAIDLLAEEEPSDYYETAEEPDEVDGID